MPKMYPTKYALSGNGEIRSLNVEDGVATDEGGPRYVYSRSGYSQQYVVSRDIFETGDAALAAAETARQKKIASLRKQIEKLEKLTFRVVEAPAP